MIYLIQEETTLFTFGTTIRTKISGYYECDNEEDVKEFCENKTKEIKGTYNEDRMCKTYIYKELSKLN
ncbi:hypothetical protein [Clostridium weizhouense]|uniref:Uncharacterized protein n=1 Tax=Clostridium weizhouense TaxID=2859781 RepID=A0ABS7AK29_9CLOT|nr:hypothetical protein [Clostridium weizhouense]MBW6408997.1 hypothetical protein [Clostridium weizhouense]